MAAGKLFSLPAKTSPQYEKWGEAARLLYVEQGFSLRAIRIKGGIPVADSTLENWARRYNWYGQRKALTQSPQGHANDIEILLAGLITELKEAFRTTKKIPKGAFDDLLKGTKALETLRGDSYFNGHLVMIEALLSDFLEVTKRTELRLELANILPQFTTYAMQKKGR